MPTPENLAPACCKVCDRPIVDGDPRLGVPATRIVPVHLQCAEEHVMLREIALLRNDLAAARSDFAAALAKIGDQQKTIDTLHRRAVPAGYFVAELTDDGPQILANNGGEVVGAPAFVDLATAHEALAAVTAVTADENVRLSVIAAHVVTE